jgi:hypothetical protein
MEINYCKIIAMNYDNIQIKKGKVCSNEKYNIGNK